MTRTIDLDIDIGADAVDYKYVSLRSLPFARPVHLPPPAPYSTLTSGHPSLYRSTHTVRFILHWASSHIHCKSTP